VGAGARLRVGPTSDGDGTAASPALGFAAGARQASSASKGSRWEASASALARAGTLSSDGDGGIGAPASALGFAAAAAEAGGDLAGGVSSGPLAELRRRVSVGQLVGGDARQMEAVVALQTLRDRLVASPPGPPLTDDAGFAARWLDFTGLRGGSDRVQGRATQGAGASTRPLLRSSCALVFETTQRIPQKVLALS